jgi:pSer/pThr/pTyr-binding forkhead associated (FHA) protein
MSEITIHKKGRENMEKLVVINDDGVTQEFPLIQKRISLGRDQTNDVCLSDKSVSRHHASLVRILSNYFLEDAASTNGTRLNGAEISKHVLKNGDLIDIGKYKLRFQDGETEQDESDLDKTVVLHPVAKKPQKPTQLRTRQATVTVNPAHVRFLSGPDEGELQRLDRSFSSIGKPGGDLILINRRHTGYYLLRMGGDDAPIVNGANVHAGGVELRNGDRIQLGKLHLEFILDKSSIDDVQYST